MSMNSLSQSIRVGFFFIFGLVLIWTVYETLTESTMYSKNGYCVKAPFSNLKQLKVGSDVRLSGVSVGSVMKSYLEDHKAVAIMMIDRGMQIPVDSVATITTSGLLGNDYIAITAGEDKALLANDSEIRTKETLDFNDVMAEIGGVVKKLDGFMSTFTGGMDEKSGIGQLVKNLNDLVVENRAKLSKTMDNLESITSKVNNGGGTLGKLVNSDELHQDLVATTESIQKAASDVSALMNDAKLIVDKVNSGQGSLGVLLADNTVADHIKDAAKNFDEFSQKLNNDKSSLGKLVSSDELYVRAQGVMTKVENAVNSVENSGPITAVGVAANALF